MLRSEALPGRCSSPHSLRAASAPSASRSPPRDIGSYDETYFDNLNPTPDGYHDLLCKFDTYDIFQTAIEGEVLEVLITGVEPVREPEEQCVLEAEDAYVAAKSGKGDIPLFI